MRAITHTYKIQWTFRVCADFAFIAERREQIATLRDFRIPFCQIHSVCEARECLVDKRRVLTSIQTVPVALSGRRRIFFDAHPRSILSLNNADAALRNLLYLAPLLYLRWIPRKRDIYVIQQTDEQNGSASPAYPV